MSPDHVIGILCAVALACVVAATLGYRAGVASLAGTLATTKAQLEDTLQKLALTREWALAEEKAKQDAKARAADLIIALGESERARKALRDTLVQRDARSP